MVVGGLVKSILHLLEAVCWTHERLVFQTIVLVQCGAKNRASFDDIRGANGPKVVGGGLKEAVGGSDTSQTKSSQGTECSHWTHPPRYTSLQFMG